MDGDIKTSEKLQKCTVWLVCGCMYIAQNTTIDLVPKFAIMLFFLTAVCFVFVVFRIVCVYVTFLFLSPNQKKSVTVIWLPLSYTSHMISCLPSTSLRYFMAFKLVVTTLVIIRGDLSYHTKVSLLEKVILIFYKMKLFWKCTRIELYQSATVDMPLLFNIVRMITLKSQT